MADPTGAPTPSTVASDRHHDAELVRQFLMTYTKDRLGRDAPVASRALAHDALDRLTKGA